MRTLLFVLLVGITTLASGCKKDKDAISLPKAGAQSPPTAVNAKPAQEPAKAPASTTLNPEDTPQISGQLALNGTTKARRVSALAPQVSGRVAKVLVKEGQIVEKGQLLVALDRRDFLLGLRQARAARATGKAQLDAAHVEWKRLSGLLKAGAIPRGTFEKIDSQIKVARAALAQADVAIAGAKNALAKTQIRAPYRAVVTRKMTEEGVYATVMPPSPVVMIEEIDTLEVVIQVPEAEMNEVKVGTSLALNFSAVGKRMTAKIVRIVPSLDPRTRSFRAFIELDNKDHSLRPGMFVEVTEPGR
ncbi:MAG: efflux RND transporter periplasmic adaptor subunit [Deltaproteobacteria bacterium]|nr:efflux RND transporter periplasmic adaptor subunit [Deltaproteobacteria bacterium]